MSELQQKTRAVFFAFPEGFPQLFKAYEVAALQKVVQETGADCSVELQGNGVVIKMASMEDFDRLAAGCHLRYEGGHPLQETSMEYTRTLPKVFTADGVREIAEVVRAFTKNVGINCTIETAGNTLIARTYDETDFAKITKILEEWLEPTIQEIFSRLSQGQPVNKDFVNPDYRPNI